MLRDQKATNPSEPWYLWFCPGANHAPHHSPQEYTDKYKGMFDEGYEAYREWVLARMIEKGVIPEGTELTPLNLMPEDVAQAGDAVRPWDTLNDDKKRLFAKMAEVYAGFSEYTDAQVGRIIEYLEKSGQLNNTIVFYCADNGASGEGSPNGSVNENKFFNGYPDELSENMQYLDTLGSPDTYNHYPTGWAVAFSTPFQMFKRYSQYSGGTCDPMVIHWPKGIKANGQVRHQYHHATDIVPTILDVIGLEMPTTYRGVEQYPMNGVSMRYSFDDADAPTTKKRQYYAMLGTRGIWEDGWKADSQHVRLVSTARFVCVSCPMPPSVVRFSTRGRKSAGRSRACGPGRLPGPRHSAVPLHLGILAAGGHGAAGGHRLDRPDPPALPDPDRVPHPGA